MNLFILLSFFFLLQNPTSVVLSASPHSILLSSCAVARHPSLCYSTISSSSLLSSISSHNDVIHASLNLAITAINNSSSHLQTISLSLSSNLTPRERNALDDCLDLFHDSLDELRLAKKDLNVSRFSAEDVKLLISGAMTNHESCIDGFSHAEVDRKLRGSVVVGIDRVIRMCENSLAMVKNVTSTDSRFWSTWTESLEGEEEVVPEVNVTVAADGSGDFRTVGAAVEAAPKKGKRRYVIRINEGRYEENVIVEKKKVNIMFVGAGRGRTVITANRSVMDGFTTFKSATLAITGERFLARDLTIENTAGPSKHQAVALRVNADLAAFYNCDILGYQDTLYAHSHRQFYRNCLIKGTVDFIFGNAAVVLQDCDIQVRQPNPGQKNMVTAHGRIDPDEPTAISIHRCKIGAEPGFNDSLNPTYLGRPWKEYSRTVIMESNISEVVRPQGWHEWNGGFGLDTLYYGEYDNRGPGAGTAQRVNWTGHRIIYNSSEAQQFAAGSLISGSGWLGSTGFPYALGL